MKVTMTEALRIHKEIAASVQQQMMKGGHVRHGICKEDGMEVNVCDWPTFPEYMEELKKIMTISEQINSIIANNNIMFGIPDKVRTRENLKVLLRSYESALMSHPTKSATKFEVLGTVKNKVNVTFEPFMTKADMKVEVKKIKAGIRSLQSEIDVANTQIVELPFEYDDLEALVKED